MKNIYIIWLLLLLVACVHPYPKEAHILGKIINDELILANICDPKSECKHIKVTGQPGEAILNIYDAGKINNHILTNIIEACLNQYELYNKKVSIELNVFSETHESVRGLFSGAEPFLKISLNAKLG